MGISTKNLYTQIAVAPEGETTTGLVAITVCQTSRARILDPEFEDNCITMWFYIQDENN